MRQLIDELEDYILISDIKTYELLYVNQRAAKLYNLPEDLSGQLCYKALRNRTAPCEDCDNCTLSHGLVKKTEQFNTHLHMAFLRRIKLIQWKGREARLELAADITEMVRVKKELNERLDTEYRLIDCINRLNASECLEKAISSTLEVLGRFFGADRLLLYETDSENRKVNSFYYWESDSCPGTWDFTGISAESLPNWKRLYETSWEGRLFYLEEVGKCDPKGYEILKKAQVKQLMCASTILPKGKVGYIEMDNPRIHLAGCTLICPYLNFVVDEIQGRRMQKELEYLSSYDELTRAGNRRRYTWFQKELKENSYKCIGIVTSNVNDMSSINTKYGQFYGDRILIHLADSLIKIFGQENVFRTSGDEFTAFCVDTEREAFEKMISSLLEEVNAENYYYAACGAVWDDTSADFHLLTDSAKEQMRQQKREFYKQGGKGVYRNDSAAEETLIGCIREGHMRVYLQPKVYVNNRKLAGAEALVRYVDEEYGVVAPGSFISRLEIEGTICYLDCFVLKTVGDLLEQRYQEGKPLITISLNFSRVTLTWLKLFEVVEEYLKGWHFPVSYIEIEITESVEGLGRQTMKLMTQRLKSLGFQISLDDFGVQYANLSVFSTVDFDVLKMDKTLIDDIEGNSKGRTVVQSVIDVCHKMETRCLAEGVEEEGQYELLKEMGCDYIQGYLFGKPAEQTAFWEQWRL